MKWVLVTAGAGLSDGMVVAVTLAVCGVTGGTGVGAERAAFPTTGLAAQYRGDAGIEKDRRSGRCGQQGSGVN